MRHTLLDRLRKHRGGLLALNAPNFSSEPGQLQGVYRRFIRVSGQYFVAETMNEIILLKLPIKTKGRELLVRTTYRAPFAARLVHLGEDYLELVEESVFTVQRLLIPLNKVVSMELHKTKSVR